MVELIDLSKIYKSCSLFRKKKVSTGVENLNLVIENGAYGLLGVNGAGKTTTLKMISTLLRPTSGRILIDGSDTVSDEKQLRTRINMITGSDRMLYFRLTGRENLLYFASLYGMGFREADRRCKKLLDLTGLEAAANKRVEQYSRGMKQRLAIARGLINDPSVLLLDEPTLGLDVSIASEIRKFIKDRILCDQSRTVILTSHYMNEIEEICGKIGILQEGRLIYNGDFEGLYRLMGMEEIHRFSIPGEFGNRRGEIERLAGSRVVWAAEAGDRLSFELPSDAGFGFLKNIDSLGISGLSYSQEKPGLEQAVIRLTSGAE